MNRLNRIVMTAILIIPFQLNAKSLSINTGVNHSWFFYPDSPKLESEFNPGYSIGIMFNNIFFEKIDLSFGFSYFNIGRYDKIEYMDIKETVTFNHIYLSSPVKVGFILVRNLIPFINIEPGIQLYSHLKHTNSFFPDEKRNITDEMNRFNLFAGFGLKYLFEIKQQKFSISGLMNYGLLRTPKDQEFDVTENSSRSWEDWRTREILVSIEYFLNIH